MITTIIKMSLIVALSMVAVCLYGSRDIWDVVGYGAALVYGGAVVLVGWCLVKNINA